MTQEAAAPVISCSSVSEGGDIVWRTSVEARPDGTTAADYVGTFQMSGGALVFHVFAIPPTRAAAPAHEKEG